MGLLLANGTAHQGLFAQNAFTTLDSDTYTISFWFWKDSRTGLNWTSGDIISVGNQDGWQKESLYLECHYSAADQPGIRFQQFFTTTDADYTTGEDLPVDQWNGVALSYDRSDPATAPVIYVNGSADTWASSTAGSGTANCVDGTAVSNDTIEIANRLGTTKHFSAAGGVDGRLAEMAMWSVELGADQLSALTTGFSPLCFRDGLQFYAPLWNNSYDSDIVRNTAVTWNSAPTDSDHPTGIIMPDPIHWYEADEAAAGPSFRRRVIIGN